MKDKVRYVRGFAEDVEGWLEANDLTFALQALKKLITYIIAARGRGARLQLSGPFTLCLVMTNYSRKQELCGYLGYHS